MPAASPPPRVLEDAAVFADRSERKGEIAAVLAALVPPSCLYQPSKPTPTRTGWMRYNRQVSPIEASVPIGTPNIDTGKRSVYAGGIHEERSNLAHENGDTLQPIFCSDRRPCPPSKTCSTAKAINTKHGRAEFLAVDDL